MKFGDGGIKGVRTRNAFGDGGASETILKYLTI